MGYQFYNLYPYNYTIFPSMDQHVDPVNEEYFDGLHTEIENIENTLGLMPQGVYGNVVTRLDDTDEHIDTDYDDLHQQIQDLDAALSQDIQDLDDDLSAEIQSIINTLGANVEEGFTNVKDKLENHGHTGGVDGKLLWGPEMDPPEITGIARYTNQGYYSGSRSGFAMYGCVYLGPGSGNRRIQSFRTADSNWNNFDPGAPDGPSPGCASDGTYIYFPIWVDPCKVRKFNPADGTFTTYTMSAGKTFWGECCVLGDYLYISLLGSPAGIAKMKLSDGTFTYYTMDAGENLGRGMDTDGTYIYMACEVSPVKLIKFDPSTGTHQTLTLPSLTHSPHHVVYAQDRIFVVDKHLNNNLVRVYPDFVSTQTFDFQLSGGAPGVHFWNQWVMQYPGMGLDGKSHAMILNMGTIRKGGSMGGNSGSSFLVYDGTYMWGSDDMTNYDIMRLTLINRPIQ